MRLMDTAISLPKALRDWLKRVSRPTKAKPADIARGAIAERAAYLEWEARALREGQKDLDQGRTMSTKDLRTALLAQRQARGSGKKQD